MTKKEFLILFENLNTLSSLRGANFAYCIAKNIKKMEPEVEAIVSAITPSERYKEYDKERIKLLKEKAKKDEEGNPVTKKENGIECFVLEGDRKELDDLIEKYNDAIEERKKQVEEYLKMLESNIEFDFHKIKVEEIPTDISVEEMLKIKDIIDD